MVTYRRMGYVPQHSSYVRRRGPSITWLVLVLLAVLIGGQFVIMLHYAASSLQQQDESMLSPLNAKLRRSKEGSTLDVKGLFKNYKNNLRHRIDQIERRIGRDDGKKNLVFLHIGKSGGTSFDQTGRQLATDLKMKYVGKKHFDWSYIENSVGGGTSMTPAISTVSSNATDGNQGQQHKLRAKDQCQVLTMLREPVDRAISHFHFMKNQKWGGAIQNESLSHFLFNTSKQHLLDIRDIWQDGQASVSWLTGTHIASWAQITKKEVPLREQIASNYTRMCLLAAERLEQTRWFGILDDIDRSLELLQWEFSLSKRPEMKHQNQNKNRLNVQPQNEDITQIEMDALASLMPQDIWLYEYAKVLFEARWNEYQTGVYIQPDKPPLPTSWSCTSTRFILNCTSGPLVDVYEKG